MAIQNATASITATATMNTFVGFRLYRQGYLDPTTGTIQARNIGTWNDLAEQTWETFDTYVVKNETIKWTSERIDLGEVKYFTLNIDTDFDGDLFFLIYVSSTGVFNGEETEYYVSNGNYNVSAFYGRYVYVTAVVTGKEFRNMTITSDSEFATYYQADVDTSTLGGTISEREISLNRSVSAIKDLKVVCKAATAYAVNLFVSDTATSEVLIPVIKSKSNTTPTFALYGIDNDPRDGIVDITIEALPRMIMYGGKLTVVG